jgi:hypothetical protein
VIILISAASLAWSIHYTRLAPGAAYFSTAARAWELGLGAALAIGASGLMRTPAVLRAMIGWFGLICIACAAVLYSDRTPFPGYAALLPALGAALVIGAGISDQEPRLGVGRLLGLGPFRYVGDRSYAYYLWHWPVLIIAVQYEGHELSVAVKLLLALGAFALSVVSYALFENPIRQMRWPAPAGALLWPASVKASQRGDPLPSPLTPPVDNLLKDIWFFSSGCTPRDGETMSKICRLGDATSAKTIVVIGDSHAQHWMPTILLMAEQDGWAILPIVKSACTPHTWLRYPQKPECPGWYKWAIGQAEALHPDVTLIAGTWAPENVPDEAVKTIASLTSAAKRFSKSVIVMGDPPKQNRQPVDCLLARHATMKTCTTTATKVQLRGDTKAAAIAKNRHIGFVDTRGWFCARLSASNHFGVRLSSIEPSRDATWVT